MIESNPCLLGIFQHLGEESQITFRLWESEMRNIVKPEAHLIMEAELTPNEIKKVFASAETIAMDSGKFKTAIGKASSVASGASHIITKISSRVSSLAKSKMDDFDKKRLHAAMQRVRYNLNDALQDRELTKIVDTIALQSDTADQKGFAIGLFTSTLESLKNGNNEAAYELLKQGAQHYNSELNESAMDFFRSLGKNLSNKLTAEKLASDWEKSGRPTDSRAIVSILKSKGLSTEQVRSAFTRAGFKISDTPPRTARTRRTMPKSKVISAQSQDLPKENPKENTITEVPVGMELNTKQGTFIWKGAQWVNKENSRVAKKELGQALTIKALEQLNTPDVEEPVQPSAEPALAPAKQRLSKLANTELKALQNRVLQGDVASAKKLIDQLSQLRDSGKDVDSYLNSLAAAMKRGIGKTNPQAYATFVGAARALRTESFEHLNRVLEHAGITWEQAGYEVILSESPSSFVTIVPIQDDDLVLARWNHYKNS